MLQQTEPLHILKNIYNEFVVTPIDKDNIELICQQIYALVLTKKLDLDKNTPSRNKTYVKSIKKTRKFLIYLPPILQKHPSKTDL